MFEALRAKIAPHENTTEKIEIGLILRPRGKDRAAVLADQAEQAPIRRLYYDFQRFENEYGADESDIEQVRDFAQRHDLTVEEVHKDSRFVLLSGHPTQITLAFSVSLEFERIGEKVVHFLSGDANDAATAAGLDDIIEGIFGLDTRPHFEFPHFHLPEFHAPHLHFPWSHTEPHAEPTAEPGAEPQEASPDEPVVAQHERVWTEPDQVMHRYDFPVTQGKGQTIGIVTLGGGFYESDMKAFFGDTLPEIEVVLIGDAKNDPASPDEIAEYLRALRQGTMPQDMDRATMSKVAWTLETTQDLQLAGTFAPGAKLVLYIGDNHKLSQLRSVLTALHDRKHDIDVLSCSWGTGENSVAPKLAQAIEACFQAAALRGVTTCCASGDHGADVVDGKPYAHFPSTCPTALSCGGTRPHEQGHEPDVVWNESRGKFVAASGGGFSQLFPEPTWQAGTGGDSRPTGRGVPDVAAKADLVQGYRMVAGGHTYSGGGTSASTPLWASLIARCNEFTAHRAGWITPLIYKRHMSRALRLVESGDNGFYKASDHWDACTGWGTPNGDRLVALLRGEQA